MFVKGCKYSHKYKKVWNYPFTFMGMSLIYERGITLSLTNLAYPNYNQNNQYNQILIARRNSAFSVNGFKSWKNVKNDKGP